MKINVIVLSFSLGLIQQLNGQTFSAQNVALLSNWYDTTVVSEPVYGIKYQGVFGWANPVDNKEYAIIGSTAGTYIIEVTNPTLPVMRDFVPGRRDSCIWREIHVFQNYCYVVSDDPFPNSFQIMDLSTLPDSVTVVHDSTNIMSRCHTIFIDGNKLYGGSPKGPFGQSSMAVFSLNDPANPVLLRRLEEDYSGLDATHDMFVRNDTVYASMSNTGYFIYKYDSVQNKFFALGSLTNYPYKGYNHSSAVTGNGISIMTDEVPAGLQVKVLDVSDPSDIQVRSSFESNSGATPHNPYVIGNDMVVIAYYQDGVQIYDISDPLQPVRTGYFDTFFQNDSTYLTPAYQGCWGAYVNLPSGNIIASDMQNGLFVLDASLALGKKEIPAIQPEFVIYPNPTHGIFTISPAEEFFSDTTITINIYNLLGKEINTTTKENTGKITMDLRTNPPGIYFIRISGTKMTAVDKFILER